MAAYGVSNNACTLIMNYFCGRQQRVKLCDTRSDWMTILKGAPQGSIFGPFGYNVFSNDLLFYMNEYCAIYNYADDNTISCTGGNIELVKQNVVKALDMMMNWFETNGMKTNPDKFQMIFFDRHKSHCDEFVEVNDIKIVQQPCVKLLGVNIDSGLNFNCHIRDICRKAGYKLNVLARLSKTLNEDSKTLLFHSFIMTLFNYCAVVWYFCDYQSAKCIEKLQLRALRLVYNDFKSTYETLRLKAGKCLVYVQRLRCILIEVHKSVGGIGPLYMQDMFKKKVTNMGIRSEGCLALQRCNTFKHGTNSFAYQGAKLWNTLSSDVKSLEHNLFKKEICNWQPDVCHCSTCFFVQI